MEKVNEIFKTTDYSIFKMMEGNRSINLIHLENIKSALGKKQLAIPIICTTDMEVFEGQHRVTACKELGLPVYYTVIDNLTLEDAITVNSISRKWTANDYFEFYLKQGNEHYKLLRDFMEYTGLDLCSARLLLTGVSLNNTNNNKTFIHGGFKVDDYNAGIERYHKYLDFNDCPAFKRVGFKQSVIKIFNNPRYDHDRMKQKLVNGAYTLTPKRNMTDYLQALSDVYNYQSTKANHLYFYLDQR